MNLLVESILSEMLEFSSRCCENFIGDVVGISSSMSLKLHPRCVFHGIEDVFISNSMVICLQEMRRFVAECGSAWQENMLCCHA